MENSFEIEGTVAKTNRERFTVTALLNSGCTGTVIDKKFAKEKDLLIHKLPIPIPIYNADGTFNDGGLISEFALLELQIEDHKEQIAMALSNLSTHNIFLGHDWLKKHNPKIDWQTQEIEFICKGDHAQNMDGVDIIRPVPELDGKDAILVIVDRFSKMIRLFPISVNITSLGVAKIFRDKIFKLHGIPQKVILDRGPQFVSTFMKELYSQLQIEGNPSMC